MSQLPPVQCPLKDPLWFPLVSGCAHVSSISKYTILVVYFLFAGKSLESETLSVVFSNCLKKAVMGMPGHLLRQCLFL